MQWLTWVPRFNTVWTCRTKAFSVAPYKQIDVCFRPPELENSRACRKLRAELKIPGLIYGAGDGKFPLMQARKAVTMSMVDVQRHWRLLGRSLENTLFEVLVDDGTSYIALPRQLQAHPVSGNPLSLNFLLYRPGTQVRVPVKYINQQDCVDIKRGAFMVPVMHYVSITADAGVPLPFTFEIDVSKFEKNKVFTLADIKLPEGVHVHKKFDPNQVLGVIKGTARA